MNKRLKKGFTLLELIIVLLVVAILAVIIIPTISNVSRKAHDTQRAANGKQLVSAAQLYHNDFEKFPTLAAPATIEQIQTKITAAKTVDATKHYLMQVNKTLLTAPQTVTIADGSATGSTETKTYLQNSPPNDVEAGVDEMGNVYAVENVSGKGLVVMNNPNFSGAVTWVTN